MKIVLAPDKFKKSLTGRDFCIAVEKGIKKVLPEAELVSIPLADGGDGTLDVLHANLSGSIRTVKVLDPLMREIESRYLYQENSKTAFIEMAEASGLRCLKPSDQNCYHTTSYGTGQLIAHALDSGADKILLGIGGSATNDCGIGMAEALGFLFIGADGKELIPVGKNMQHVKYIVNETVHPLLSKAEIVILCDVSNPLYGTEGAAHIYAPQKGASENEVEQLDLGLRHMDELIEEKFGFSVSDVPGAGAAGGMGAGGLSFLSASLVSGIDAIKDLVDFDRQIKKADWILSGEGELDEQTQSGKTISGVLNSVNGSEAKVALFCGSSSISKEKLKQMGVDYLDTVMHHAKTLDKAMEHAPTYLELMGVEFAKKISVKG